MNEYAKSSGGLLVPAHVADIQRLPRALDLFCGCGGFSLGLLQAGYEVLAGVDSAADAAQTYMLNLGAYPCQFIFVTEADRKSLERTLAPSFRGKKGELTTRARTAGSGWRANNQDKPGVRAFFLGDIRQLTGAQIMSVLGLEVGELDLIAGGPPCQGFSISGKRNVMDPRNSLVFEFARLVCEIRPKAMILENVPGITNMVTPDGVPVLDALGRVLEDGGFGGLDAFHRSLKAQAGTAGLMRGKPPAKKDGRGQSEPDPRQGAGEVQDWCQLDLFAAQPEPCPK